VNRKLADYTMADVGGAVLSVVDDLMPAGKGEGDFTVSEFRAAVMASKQVELSYRQASYRLANLEEAGKIERVQRMDPMSGRVIICFRRVKGDAADD